MDMYAKAEDNIQTALNLALVLAEERPHDVELQVTLTLTFLCNGLLTAFKF